VPIVLHRVDNRLVHGQVLEAWVPRLRADAIVVADEAVAADAFRKALIEGMGQGVIDIRVLPPAAAAAALASTLKDRSVVVLYETLEGVRQGREQGIPMERVNLGNLHPHAGRRSLTPSVRLEPEEETLLRGMMIEGVLVDARALPSDVSPDVARVLDEPLP
jgi:PTS system mannose-specific IIB component